MKKVCLFLLCLLIVLGGCAEKETQMPAQTEAPTAPKILSAEDQAALIAANRALWEEKTESEYETYYYTFLDLDHNGRLEVFAAITQGTGIFTSGAFYEVNESYDALTKYVPEEGNFLPEVIVSSVKCFELDGQYFYPFVDSTRNGAAESWSAVEWLSVKNGRLNMETIAWAHLQYDFETGKEISTYSDANGTISETEFASAADRAGSGMRESRVSLYWRPAEEYRSAEDIMLSYRVFLGEAELPRPETACLMLNLEGMTEEMPARLYSGDGYSIYIPEENWEHFSVSSAGEMGEVWWYSYNHDIQMQIVKLSGMNLAQAQSWVRQQNPGFDLTEDRRGGLAGMDRQEETILDARILTANGSSYVIFLFYPPEAAEGGGVRLNVIADSFELL